MRFIEESSVPTSGYAYARMAFQTQGSLQANQEQTILMELNLIIQ